MRRVFSLLTNISLSEYIRKRRLSVASYDLYNDNLKVIDVAIKYGYENATSFSRAFSSFHGIKPLRKWLLLFLKRWRIRINLCMVILNMQ